MIGLSPMTYDIFGRRRALLPSVCEVSVPVVRVAAMANAFTTLWTHDRCRALRKAGLVGSRPPVAFSGIHSSLPSWVSVCPDDDVYALHVNRCVVYVVSRMRVLDKERHDCCGPVGGTWHDPAFPGHDGWSMLGLEGCSAAAVHVSATPITFSTAVPGDMLARLTWQNRRGQTRGLKYLVDGRLESSVSLQGVYHLTPVSADELAGLIQDAPAMAR